MALSKGDLEKIGEIVDRKVTDNNALLFERLATKDEVREIVREETEDMRTDIRQVKDDVGAIRYELDTEHEVRRAQVERNTKDISVIKQELQKIED